MKPYIKKIGVLFIHFLFWCVFGFINHLINAVNYIYSDEWPLIPDTITKYIVAAFIFYSCSILIGPLLINKRKYLLSIISIIFLSFVSHYLKEFLFSQLWPIFGYEAGPYNFIQAYVLNLWWVMMYGMLGLGYSLARDRIEREKERSQLEREKLQLEYANLRSQINPHFLLNALNFFYAESIGASAKLTKGILYLAEIMRYAISNGEDEAGFISVGVEITQITNMIGINQLRYSDTLKIQFEVVGNVSEKKIIPYVILTLVENAFKHGQLSNGASALVIRISYDEENELFETFIENQIAPNREKTAGLGINNIRKRLALTYGDRHSLDIQEDSNHYSVNLSINM